MFNRDPSPFWRRTISFILLLFVIIFFAYTNASNFDETEYKLIIEIAIFLLGKETVTYFYEKRKNG